MRKADAALAARENVFFLKETEKALKAGRVVSAAAEAVELALRLSGASRLDLFTGAARLSPAVRRKTGLAVRRRASGEPLAHILGTAPFYGRDFIVNRHTLVPRPETELLAEKTLEIIARRGLKNPRILELGTGSGCLAVSLTIECPDCKMTALDISSEALKIARKNAVFHHVGKRITFRRGDLFQGAGKSGSRWDIVVSNPPYIPAGELRGLPREVRREPRLALDGGPRGLDVILRILGQAPAYLKDGGHLFLEIGKGQSRELAQRVARMSAYGSIKFFKDLNGIDRVLSVQKIGGPWTS